jgi:phenylacetate-CoA ligase
MSGVFWNQKIQKASIEELRRLQLRLLRRQIHFVSKKSKFYHRKFTENRENNLQIKSLKDIEKFPFTTREEIYFQFHPGKSQPSA